MTKEYFQNTVAISNSQLRSFVKYGKFGKRILTPDTYNALYIEKTKEFKTNDAMIVGKIVDRYFDWTGDDVWNFYIPVDRRTGKEIEALIAERISGVDTDEEREEVRKHIKENYMEITKSMEAEALEMISWGKAFKKFREFITLPDTQSQFQLHQEFEIADEDGVLHRVQLKGLPDYVNHKEKLIVDLKTTGSIDMIVEDLQFKGKPNLTANYIRQLALYNFLMGGDYRGALALVTDTGVKWIDIPNEVLVAAMEIVKKDLIELKKYIENPNSLNESIFIEEETTLELE